MLTNLSLLANPLILGGFWFWFKTFLNGSILIFYYFKYGFGSNFGFLIEGVILVSIFLNDLLSPLKTPNSTLHPKKIPYSNPSENLR
jgi:hypothetical protein